MTTVWRSLLWKEYREQRWILVAILAIGIFGPAPFAWRDADIYRVGLTMMGMLFVPLASLFVGAWIAAGEQSRRTIDFLQALPTPASHAARIKLICAAGVILAPGVAAFAIAAVLGWQYRADLSAPETREVVVTLATFSLAPLSLMMWTAALGANVRDEIRAGVISLAGITGIWLAAFFLGFDSDRPNDMWPTWLRVVSAIAPGSPPMVLTLLSNSYALITFVVITLMAHAAVACAYLRRFGRVSLPRQGTTTPVRQRADQARWLAAPRANALSAIVWKQWRETAPLAGLGLAAIVGISVIIAVTFARLDRSTTVQTALCASFGVWVTLGYAVAIVCGIGLLHDDLRPGLHTFWRSRPVRLRSWFATKLTSSLAITLASLAAPPVLVAALLQLISAPYRHQYLTWEGACFIAGILAFQLCGFLVAVAATALLRTATAAALITLLLTVLTGYLADKLPLDPHTDLPYFFGAAGIVAAAAITAAWVALKKDWRIG